MDDKVQYGRGAADDMVQVTQAYEISDNDNDGDARGLRASKQPRHISHPAKLARAMELQASGQRAALPR